MPAPSQTKDGIMADRTTKLLLGIIAIALIANLLLPLATGHAVLAAPAATETQPILFNDSGQYVLIVRNGKAEVYSLNVSRHIMDAKQPMLDLVGSQQLVPPPAPGSKP
jgi:hypothetical protein